MGKEFLKEPRLVSNFFKMQGLRERFQQMCLTGQNRRHLIMFDDFPATYMEWRWNSLMICFRHILLIHPILALCWDSKLMAAKGQHAAEQCGRDDEFQKADCVEDVGRVIHSPTFWAYTQMLVYFGHAADKFLGWCQTCPCHPVVAVRRACRLAEDVSSDRARTLSCPLLGCRVACMANGHWWRFLRGVFDTCAGDIIALTVGMPIEARDTLLTDWARGQDALLLGLTQIDFLRQLAAQNVRHGFSGPV